MSGGSFNYLCFKDGLELVHHTDELDRMAAFLRRWCPEAEQAAMDTTEIADWVIAQAKAIEARVAEFQDLWHEVEWWQSGDCGEDRAREALARFYANTRSGTENTDA